MKLTRTLSFVCCLVLAATSAHAQDIATFELSGGYQLLRMDGGTSQSTFPRGWYADLAWRLTDYTSLILQGGGSASSVDDHISSGIPRTVLGDVLVRQFMAGARYGAPSDKNVQPFVQLLIGGANIWDDVTVVPDGAPFTQSDYWVTRFAAQVGGGVSLRLAGRLGVRVDAAYLKVLTDSKSDRIRDFVGSGNAVRAGAGLVLWF